MEHQPSHISDAILALSEHLSIYNDTVEKCRRKRIGSITGNTAGSKVIWHHTLSFGRLRFASTVLCFASVYLLHLLLLLTVNLEFVLVSSLHDLCHLSVCSALSWLSFSPPDQPSPSSDQQTETYSRLRVGFSQLARLSLAHPLSFVSKRCLSLSWKVSVIWRSACPPSAYTPGISRPSCLHSSHLEPLFNPLSRTALPCSPPSYNLLLTTPSLLEFRVLRRSVCRVKFSMF